MDCVGILQVTHPMHICSKTDCTYVCINIRVNIVDFVVIILADEGMELRVRK